MVPVTLSALYIYPIKSCRGHAVDTALVTPRGLQDDRLLMIVDGEGTFLTQREYPTLALLEPTLGEELLTLRAPGMEALDLAVRTSGPHGYATVWNDTCEVFDQGELVAEWLSAYLGTPARLVRLSDTFRRSVDPCYARNASDQTSFADGYPFLLISQGSLADLNGRLESPLSMDRFRPNLVVAGCEPFAEDGWHAFQLGSVTFYGVKPCARCQIITVDQQSAAVGREPLRTLSTFRNFNQKVLFGQNLLCTGSGLIRTGDRLTIAD